MIMNDHDPLMTHNECSYFYDPTLACELGQKKAENILIGTPLSRGIF